MPPFTITRAQPRVTEEFLPGARQNIPAGPADFGAFEAGVIRRVGTGITQVGEAAIDVEQRKEKQRQIQQATFKDRRDKVLATDALMEYKSELRKQSVVFKDRRGINAWGVENDAEKFANKTRNEIKGKQENDNVRGLFDAASNVATSIFLNQWYTHGASEFNKAEDASHKARENQAVEDASLAVGSNQEDLVLQNAKNDLLTALQMQANKQGFTGVQAKEIRDKRVSDFHKSYLNAKVVDDAEEAKEYFDTHNWRETGMVD